jgi:hypothetical protein
MKWSKRREEDSEEFQSSFGLKKAWCPHCRKRTPHEYDSGTSSGLKKLPGEWWCTICGEVSGI